MSSLKRCLHLLSFVIVCFLDLNELFEKMYTFVNLCQCLFLGLNEQFEEMLRINGDAVKDAICKLDAQHS